MTRLRVALLALGACGGGGSGALDASGAVDTGAVGDAATASRCTASEVAIACTSHDTQLAGRTVTYEVPLGTPPTAGWPVVVYFQGSFVAGARAFGAAKSDTFGAYNLSATVKALLDAGYAVIAPNAPGDGTLYWQTNVPPYATQWSGCEDDLLVRQLLDAISALRFGPLDADRRYAMGISSGGFMTSRMAISYDGVFRALAIASASYATCSQSCTVPPLPADHPPTLFLHGGTDQVVPVATMMAYRDALAGDGRVVDAIVDPNAGHEWIAGTITAVPAWFDAH